MAFSLARHVRWLLSAVSPKVRQPFCALPYTVVTSTRTGLVRYRAVCHASARRLARGCLPPSSSCWGAPSPYSQHRAEKRTPAAVNHPCPSS